MGIGKGYNSPWKRRYNTTYPKKSADAAEAEKDNTQPSVVSEKDDVKPKPFEDVRFVLVTHNVKRLIWSRDGLHFIDDEGEEHVLVGKCVDDWDTEVDEDWVEESPKRSEVYQSTEKNKYKARFVKA